MGDENPSKRLVEGLGLQAKERALLGPQEPEAEPTEGETCLCTTYSPMERVDGAVYDPGGWRVPNPQCPIHPMVAPEPTDAPEPCRHVPDMSFTKCLKCGQDLPDPTDTRRIPDVPEERDSADRKWWDHRWAALAVKAAHWKLARAGTKDRELGDWLMEEMVKIEEQVPPTNPIPPESAGEELQKLRDHFYANEDFQVVDVLDNALTLIRSQGRELDKLRDAVGLAPLHEIDKRAMKMYGKLETATAEIERLKHVLDGIRHERIATKALSQG